MVAESSSVNFEIEIASFNADISRRQMNTKGENKTLSPEFTHSHQLQKVYEPIRNRVKLKRTKVDTKTATIAENRDNSLISAGMAEVEPKNGMGCARLRGRYQNFRPNGWD